MQRYDWEEAPLKPLRSLIYQEDRPKLPIRKENEYKYMSDYVWDQINEHISKMDSQYVPIVILMERTGLHLVEILSLKLDCLLSTPEGNWLISERTRLKQIPVSQEIADLIKDQQRAINEAFPREKNPYIFLFLRRKGKCNFRGKPFNQQSVIRQLKFFAIENNIREENGVYLNPDTGHPQNTSLPEQAFKNQVQLDWLKRNLTEVRLEEGYCIKSPRTHCQYLNQAAEPSCMIFKCSSFYVDLSFSDYYEAEIEKMKYAINEAHKHGKIRYSELIKAIMDKFIEIRNVLNTKVKNHDVNLG
jgi:hypothetical protein